MLFAVNISDSGALDWSMNVKLLFKTFGELAATMFLQCNDGFGAFGEIAVEYITVLGLNES